MSITFSSPSRAMTFSSTSGTTFQAGGTQTYNWDQVSGPLNWSALSGTYIWPDASGASSGPASSAIVGTIVDDVRVTQATFGPYITLSDDGTTLVWETQDLVENEVFAEFVDETNTYLQCIDGILSFTTTSLNIPDEPEPNSCSDATTSIPFFISCDTSGNIQIVTTSVTYIECIVEPEELKITR